MPSQLSGLIVGVGVVCSSTQISPLPSAVPLEPIAAILDAFRSHNVVALSEPHRNEQAHALRLALIRHPKVATVVNDIVWECGSARYQDVMDRFIGGEDVPVSMVSPAWQDTVGSIGPVCDHQIYDFLRAVRDVNVGLPRERRLRVLLGDPPIDWSVVQRVETPSSGRLSESHTPQM